MNLAALYIKKHEYLFDEPQTINFGGKYFYSFSQEGNNIFVKRTRNKYYIPDFFNLTSLPTKVTNLNAIVGQNGAGKSTLLDIIRSEFVQNEYALPSSDSLLLVEYDGDDGPVILRNDFEQIFLVSSENPENRQNITKSAKGLMQTIYYSPHFDYKFNPNFDNVDNHDISFDRIIDKDLNKKGLKETNENGWDYPASQELLFKNSLRQIHFLQSPLVKKQKIFRDLFEFQDHHDPILHFRPAIKKDNWNTPSQFRILLEDIANQVSLERDQWIELRDRDATRLEIDQYFLKLHVISCVLSILHLQMEKYNTFLQEGYFPYAQFEEELKNATAYNMLLLFIEHSAIQFNDKKPDHVFGQTTFRELLQRIYAVIDNTKDEDQISQTTVRTLPDDAIAILTLQRAFLSELNVYYIRHYQSKEKLFLKEEERLPEFINYMPFSRRMSSGENALLNFFSRLYDFLEVNLGTTKAFSVKKHYILLLDEADLTFHLSWKKRFIKAILKTLPYLFNELNNTPSIEIIFTTHDPITLSDTPNGNVIYLSRPSYHSSSNTLDFTHPDRPRKTFGANISELIADSFFIEKTPVGDFATDKIQGIIAWLNNKNTVENAEYYRRVIGIIDEPIVQRKLSEMFDEKMQTNFQLQIVKDQIKRLEILRGRLEA